MTKVVRPVRALALGLIVGVTLPGQSSSPVKSADASHKDAPELQLKAAIDEVEAQLEDLEPEIAIAASEAAFDVQAAVQAHVQPLIDTPLDIDFPKDLNENLSRSLRKIGPRIAINLPPRAFDFVPDEWQESWGGFKTEDRYRQGTRAIDHHDYEKAIAAMDEVIAAKTSRSDGAYYWKAYAQSKLGRTSDALSTLAALERNFPKSAWLNDAKALEMQTRQNAGQRVSPDAEANEDLKLLAINGLMHSDPAQATPLVEKVLNDPKNTPKVRERALFVLARSEAPQARQTVARFAEGNANPDLQIKAIQYLAATDGKENPEFFERVYKRASDPAVKRAALRALFLRKDQNALTSIAKSEPNLDLRRQSMQFLGAMGATDSLTRLYGSEPNADVKRSILDALCAQGDGKDLVAIARREPDPKLKREAVERLSSMDSKEAKEYMLELLGK
jgi:hypothetical protein